jgi:nucleoside-diphosphate-sugar epimerase
MLRDTGWSPRIGLRAGIASTVEWYRLQQWRA